FSAELEIPDILMGVEPWHNPEPNSLARILENGRLRIESYNTEGDMNITMFLGQKQVIPPGVDVPVTNMGLCIADGVAPGAYPIKLLSAELIDAASVQAIAPALESGTLTVFQTVNAGLRDCWPYPRAPLPINALIKVGEAKGKPGSDISLPLTLRANGEITGYSLSLDFDERVLEATSIDYWPRPDGEPYFTKYEVLDSKDRTPGNGGVDEGFVLCAIVFGMDGDTWLPANTDNVAATLNFKIRPGAPSSSTPIRFLNGAQGPTTPPISNLLGVFYEGRGYSVNPETAASMVFIDGKVSILPDIAVFVRGDANDDRQVDISDP